MGKQGWEMDALLSAGNIKSGNSTTTNQSTQLTTEIQNGHSSDERYCNCNSYQHFCDMFNTAAVAAVLCMP